MKIVVLSDTHIPLSAKDLPDKIYEDIKSADLLLHAGDIVSLGFFNKLKGASSRFEAVCGNMDEPELKKVLARKKIVKANKRTIGLIHGWGSPLGIMDIARREFQEEKPDIIVFGHSHQSLCLQKDGILFFNPGSPTDKVFSSSNSYGVITINDKIEPRIIEV